MIGTIDTEVSKNRHPPTTCLFVTQAEAKRKTIKLLIQKPFSKLDSKTHQQKDL